MPKKIYKVRLLTHTQSCRYCHQDFVPTRRGTQLYCSDSCRTTYCRKRKQGTLHRLVQLPGPAGPRVPFSDLFLAATAGSLTANTVTQTTEYHLVTKGLLEQIAQLQEQLRQQVALNQQQGQLLAQLQRDQQRLLRALGVPPEAAPASPAAELAAEYARFPAMPAPAELPELPTEPLLGADELAYRFPPIEGTWADGPPGEPAPDKPARVRAAADPG